MKTQQNVPTKSNGKIRYGVVGLGYIAQSAILPAFANARKNSELVALVSDDPVKLKTLGRKYGAMTFSYDDYAKALQQVDAVFIALPNSLHRAYTELAAEAKVHVLCEKPLAMDVDDCEQMIEACEAAGVRLMTAYRLHFERTNLEAIDIARKKLGTLRMFTASFANKVDAGNIRLQEGEGGPLFDIGIYCLNAARSVFRAEPTEVSAFTATSPDERFQKVPEMLSVMMKFPDDRLASFTCSFAAASSGWYEVSGTKGTIRVDPAYEIAKDLTHAVTMNGKKARTKTNKARDQFAPEILYFSDCILRGRSPEPSGREGLADVRVMNAIERSINEGRPVKLDAFTKTKRPDLNQEISRPVGAEQPLVHAAPPSQD